MTATVTAADGYRLAVQLRGDPDAPPLLLLPGQAGSHMWWDGVRERFDREFRTITFDYRGTGDSPEAGAVTGAHVGDGGGRRPGWTMATFAADAAAVLRAVTTGGQYTETGPGAHVFGTSMGGRVAQALTLENPELVTRVVLACTGPGGAHEVSSSSAVRTALLKAPGAERSRLLFDLFYSPAWTGTVDESTLLGDPGMTRQARAAHLRVSRSHDAWDRLPHMSRPTLILHGDDDRMCPVDNAWQLAGRIPGAQAVSYPHGRHGFFEEFADRVIPRVRDFLLR